MLVTVYDFGEKGENYDHSEAQNEQHEKEDPRGSDLIGAEQRMVGVGKAAPNFRKEKHVGCQEAEAQVGEGLEHEAVQGFSVQLGELPASSQAYKDVRQNLKKEHMRSFEEGSSFEPVDRPRRCKVLSGVEEN
eukprot:CAMPEP_0197572194 /NCGR_PEP_ID=MMETSP1320-20131121/42339_1 /TAXON_ID=91990 /ORGANISM="Bolidomonas sp., Strain RCC2347" /LENGTH=132 /DNA_ID=CAMNT_0043134697 /DNA_START=941 /DNA_END=1338 /DNA_ORIENTATION=-